MELNLELEHPTLLKHGLGYESFSDSEMQAQRLLVNQSPHSFESFNFYFGSLNDCLVFKILVYSFTVFLLIFGKVFDSSSEFIDKERSLLFEFTFDIP